MLNWLNKEGITGNFTPVKFTPVKSKRKETRQDSEEDGSSESSSGETETETEKPNARLFSCPEERCMKCY